MSRSRRRNRAARRAAPEPEQTPDLDEPIDRPAVATPQRAPLIRGPELAGGIASVLVLSLLALLLVGGPVAGDGGSSPLPTATAVASTEPTGSPPLDLAIADLLIVVNQQLIGSGEDLAEEAERDPLRTAEVSALIREINGNARFASEALPALGDTTIALDLRDRLGIVYDELVAIAGETLRASVTNAAALRQGATGLVEALEALPALQLELEALVAGEGPTEPPATAAPPSASPTAVPSPSPAPPTASPTGAPTAPPASPSSQPSPSGPALPSQIENGGFEAGVGPPWELRLDPAARADLSTDTATSAAGQTSARVDIAVATQSFGSVMLRQGGLAVEAGRAYQVRLAMRASELREVRIRLVSTSGATYLTRTAAVDSPWITYDFVFTAAATDQDAALEIALGRSTTTTWIDEVAFVTVPVTP